MRAFVPVLVLAVLLVARPPRRRISGTGAFALGGEVGVTLAALRGRLSARYERELEVRARSEGQILVFQLSLAVWAPEPARNEAPPESAPQDRARGGEGSVEGEPDPG